MRARDGLPTYIRRAGTFLVFVAISLAPRTWAQDCKMCAGATLLTAKSPNSWTLRKQVNEVQVLFTATRHGKFVTGLTRGDVTVRDDGQPGEIVDFRDQNNLPLRIALLVDTSDSIRERFSFEKEAAAIFLRQVLRSDADQAMVAGFDTRLHVAQGFSHDPKLLSAGIARLSAGGMTAVYDAVYRACRMLNRPGQGVVARVIVVLSDGDDNASKLSRNAALAFAQQSEVTIYTISTSYRTSDFSGDKNLERLAGPTGGQALFPGTARNVRRAFARISDELHHRYAVAYHPLEFDANGRFRRIRIAVRKSGKKLKVKARKGYYAR